ncbi:MAG: hypothetical protein U0931_24345 [Vulcanimicrobiota bacterium]
MVYCCVLCSLSLFAPKIHNQGLLSSLPPASFPVPVDWLRGHHPPPVLVLEDLEAPLTPETPLAPAGFALVAVLFSLLISVILGSVYAAHIVSQIREAKRGEYSSQSAYVAMAGLHYGIHLLRKLPNPEPVLNASTSVTVSLGGDFIGTATVSYNPTTALLSSDGVVTRSDGVTISTPPLVSD